MYDVTHSSERLPVECMIYREMKVSIVTLSNVGQRELQAEAQKECEGPVRPVVPMLQKNGFSMDHGPYTVVKQAFECITASRLAR